jgi:hypothetical protein
MNITETVIAKAKELLDAEPAGIKFAKLYAALHAALPEVKPNTLYSCFTKIRSTLKEYNPEKGLYRSPKFNNAAATLSPSSDKTSQAAHVKEEAFYESFSEFAMNVLQEADKAIPLGGNCFKDKWGTPDVIGVLRPKESDIFKFSFEILSAEIKKDSTDLIKAFGQACAYKLFSHRSYLVVPVSSGESDLSRLDSLCMICGIGLIVFNAQKPDDPGFDIRARASRNSPDMFYVNKYLRKEVADKLLS